MIRKFTTLGLVILIAGAVTFGCVLAGKRKEQQRSDSFRLKYDSETNECLVQYYEWMKLPAEERAQLPPNLDEYRKSKTKAQLRLEQQERLIADLDRLATGETDVSNFADVLYGENWQEELTKYKRRKELGELVLSASIMCSLTGGAILSLSLLLLTARLIIRGASGVAKLAVVCLRGQEKTKPLPATSRGSAQAPVLYAPAFAGVNLSPLKRGAETGAKTKAKMKARGEAEKLAKAEEKARAKAEAKEKARAKAEARAKAKAERKARAKAEKLAKAEEKKRAKAEAKARAKAEAEERMRLERQRSQACQPATKVKDHSKVLSDSGWRGFEVNSANEAEKIHVLFSDEKSIELEESLKAATENVNVSLKLRDSLKAQTENLERQMAEFKQMTQSVQQAPASNKQGQAAVGQSEPINDTLTELTRQVAAIREYAACQQSRLEKLQAGYDWNIIRTFCLRFIRCIDNIESRISRLAEQDIKTTYLEEIRDELIFALESSGVEQFRPEINSDYSGQEKYAETVKGKESCKEPGQKGKIAKVIRPGYQYFISEGNVKVVRPAQVRLFG